MNPGHRNVTIGDLFTDADLSRGAEIIRANGDAGNVALIDKLQSDVIEPALHRLNQITGQEDNNPRYLAYLLEHILRNGGVR